MYISKFVIGLFEDIGENANVEKSQLKLTVISIFEMIF
jgi:hypothetical protein